MFLIVTATVLTCLGLLLAFVSGNVAFTKDDATGEHVVNSLTMGTMALLFVSMSSIIIANSLWSDDLVASFWFMVVELLALILFAAGGAYIRIRYNRQLNQTK